MTGECQTSAVTVSTEQKRPTRIELGEEFRSWLLEAGSPQSWDWILAQFCDKYGALYEGMSKKTIHSMVSRALVRAQTHGRVRIVVPGPLYEGVR